VDSESTGDVRIWRRGKMITEPEKATRTAEGAPPKPAGETGEG